MEYLIYYGSWVLAIGAVLFASMCAVWYRDEREYSTSVLYPKLREAGTEFRKAKTMYDDLSEKYLKLKTYVNEEVIALRSLITASKDQVEREVKSNQTRIDRIESDEKTKADEYTLKIENLTERLWSVEKRTASPGSQTPLLDRAGVTKP